MITHEVPAILDQRLSMDGDAKEYLIEGEDGSQAWKSEEYVRDNYGDCPESPKVVAQVEPQPDPTGEPPRSVTRIDSAQHLLQSISSDDDGSRSPSPVRRSPPSIRPEIGGHEIPDADIEMTTSQSPSALTIDDLFNQPDSEIASNVINLVAEDRPAFICHATKKFSHEMMESLIRNQTFLSEIECWCRAAIDNQDTAFVEDLLLFIELLPVSDASNVTALFQLLSESRTFNDMECSPLASRIVKKWSAHFPNTFDKSKGGKSDEGTGSKNASGPTQASSASNFISNRSSRPSHPAKSQNNRSRRTQPSYHIRRSSPRASPGRSGRPVSNPERHSPTFRRLSPLRRPLSPRDLSPPKMFNQSGSGRRSQNDDHFSRDPPPRPSHNSGRSSDSKGPLDSRSGSDYRSSRPSPYPRDTQRPGPRSSPPPLRREPNDRSVTSSHRFDSAPDSRPRDVDRFSSSASTNSTPYSRQPSKVNLKYDDDLEKGHYNGSGNRHSYGRIEPQDLSHTNANRSNLRRESDFDKPRDPGPGSYKSGMQDSRPHSKYTFDDDYSRPQKQSHPPLNDRSVSSKSARSRSPASYRPNNERNYTPDSSRNLRRYDEPAFKGAGPNDYRDDKPFHRRDDRHSDAKDYRRDFEQNIRQDEHRMSLRRNDPIHDSRPSHPKRKPDFKPPYDGPYKSMRLSDFERKELVAKGACLYCRKPGHTINECRTRPARS